MELSEVIALKNKLKFEIDEFNEDYFKKVQNLDNELKENTKDLKEQLLKVSELIFLSENLVDVEKTQLAESLLEIKGDIYAKVEPSEDGNAAGLILKDLAEKKTSVLMFQYCNIKVDGRCISMAYLSKSPHETPGTLIGGVWLKDLNRNTELTSKETNACIYYILNYNNIKNLIVKFKENNEIIK